MAIARYYNPEANPLDGMLPGVPLADIDEEIFNAYPEWLQRSIDALPFYRKTKVRTEARPDTPARKESE
jgi:hypothetical protein